MSDVSYFDEVAPNWDSIRAGCFSEGVREKAFLTADLEPGKTAADLGAGTGFITEGLLRRGLSVIAIDRSNVMIEQMRKKFSKERRIYFRRGEGENLPVADNSVDYVFANMYLHHVEHPPRGIAEAVRILKAGGSVVITDLDEHRFEFLRTEQKDVWLGFKRQDVQNWLEAAGLTNVHVDCIEENCCTCSTCGSGSAKISIFLAIGNKPRKSSSDPTREKAFGDRNPFVRIPL